MSDTEFQILWYLCKEQIYSRTFTVLFLEILSYSGVDTTPRLLSDISILFTGISTLTAYFYLTLNHRGKNTEIAMSDKSTGSLPAFCLQVANTRYFKENCKDLHRRQLFFCNMAIQYLFSFHFPNSH